MYLLIRAADSESCTQRLQQVFAKDVFVLLRDKWGTNLNSFMTEKVVAVYGDISGENLGIEDFKVRQEMWKEIDIIINIAATTDFYERYDISFGINTLGALNVLSFARKCINMKMLLHVSTAFVGDLNKKLMLEKPLYMGKSINKAIKLDIEMENKVIEKKLNELRQQSLSEKEITKAMKDFGNERARLYGWSNTYVFTKAMGEMLLNQYKDDDMLLIIIRPTMILSTYKEPFPGWIEGLKTMDGILVSYGKGKISCFLGSEDTIFDVIPADMVVNSMMVAMVNHGSEVSKNIIIYHVGSSSRNILTLGACLDYAYQYFSVNRFTSKNGKSVKIKKFKLFTTIPKLSRYVATRYGLPLKVLHLVNVIFWQKYKKLYVELDSKLKVLMRLAEIFEPFLFIKEVFDDTNTENLRIAMRENNIMNNEAFNFDPKEINWDDYFINTHFPGLMKHVVTKKN
ncbi:hypothetical protein ACFE04_023164 [Oxalis oulophora]